MPRRIENPTSSLGSIVRIIVRDKSDSAERRHIYDGRSSTHAKNAKIKRREGPERLHTCIASVLHRIYG